MADASHDRHWEPLRFAGDHRDRLAELVVRPDRVDGSAVTALVALLAGLRELEDAVGSRPVVLPCGATLTVIERTVAAAHGPLRGKLIRVGSQYAQLLGWLHTSLADVDRAQAHCLLARALANEVDDLCMAATAMSMLGYLGYQQGRFDIAMEYSVLIESDLRVSPASRALAAQQVARVFATWGHGDQCDRYLDRAATHLDRALSRRDDEPPWLYYYSAAHLRLQRGRAYALLGRHQAAAEELTAGFSDMATPLRHAEWTRGYRVTLDSALEVA